MALPEQTLVGVFDDRAHAQQAAAELRRAGFEDHRLQVFAPGSCMVCVGVGPGRNAEPEDATGAAAEALAGLGLPEREARYCAAELRAGAFLVAVRACGRAGDAQFILRRNGGRVRGP